MLRLQDNDVKKDSLNLTNCSLNAEKKNIPRMITTILYRKGQPFLYNNCSICPNMEMYIFDVYNRKLKLIKA